MAMVRTIMNYIQIALRLATHRGDIEKLWPQVTGVSAEAEKLWPRVQALSDEVLKLSDEVMKLNTEIRGLMQKIVPELTGPQVVQRYDVRWLQQSLQELGYDPGPIDGIMGPRTQAAVAAFQQNSGLVVDGWAGVATEAAIDNLLRQRTT